MSAARVSHQTVLDAAKDAPPLGNHHPHGTQHASRQRATALEPLLRHRAQHTTRLRRGEAAEAALATAEATLPLFGDHQPHGGMLHTSAPPPLNARCVRKRSARSPSNERGKERPSRPPLLPLNPHSHCLDTMCCTPSTSTIATHRAAHARARVAALEHLLPTSSSGPPNTEHVARAARRSRHGYPRRR